MSKNVRLVLVIVGLVAGIWLVVVGGGAALYIWAGTVFTTTETRPVAARVQVRHEGDTVFLTNASSPSLFDCVASMDGRTTYLTGALIAGQRSRVIFEGHKRTHAPLTLSCYDAPAGRLVPVALE